METRATRQVYANPWMTVREDSIRRPDGSDGIYGVVDKPAYALIIALDDTADTAAGVAGVAGAGAGAGPRLALVEQYRYPLGMRRWEFPQGTAPDRAEMPPRELAARELREETGLDAERWTELGTLDVAPGLSSQRGRVFLATGLTWGLPEREETEADMCAGWVTRPEFEDMIRSGRVSDAQSIAAYGMLLLHESGGRAPLP